MALYEKRLFFFFTAFITLVNGCYDRWALAVGFVMTNMDPTPLKWTVYGLHKTCGVLVLVLLVIRIIVRLTSTVPPHPEGLLKIHKAVSSISPYVLYFFMAAMVLTGYVMSDAGGHVISLFNKIPLPLLFEKNPELSHFTNEMHEFLAIPFAAVIVLHIAASFYHHIVLKNNTLKNMLGR